MTKKSENTEYYHVKIAEDSAGRYRLLLPNLEQSLDLTPYLTLVDEAS